MTEPGQRALDDAIRAALSKQAAVERYRRSQRQARGGQMRALARARLEFDESGFPVRQPNAGFAARVAQLLRLE